MDRRSKWLGALGSLVRAVVLVAALLALPRTITAQPPGGGDCTACATGFYCVPDTWGGLICYDDATFCATGTEVGWNSCSANPPYGPCTVSGGACPDEQALLSLPEGTISGVPEVLLASALPCETGRAAGAVARAVWIDSRSAGALSGSDPLGTLLSGQ